MIASATAPRNWTSLIGNVDGVSRKVAHSIDVNPDVVLGMKNGGIEEN
jgi:hypothetical protein